jgi:hypothetical protein
MRSWFLALSLAAFAVLAVACSSYWSKSTSSYSSGGDSGGGPTTGKSPREALLDKDIGVLEDVTSTLGTVKDQPSLVAARPKLNELVKKHDDIKQEAQKLGAPTQQEKDAMLKYYGDRQAAGKKKLMTEMRRVLGLGSPEAQAVYGQMVEFGRDF